MINISLMPGKISPEWGCHIDSLKSYPSYPSVENERMKNSHFDENVELHIVCVEKNYKYQVC